MAFPTCPRRSATRWRSQRCAFMAPKRKPILPSLAGDREGEAAQLARDARTGLEARLALYPELTEEERSAYVTRLDFEVGVITQMGFPGYFLIEIGRAHV